MGERVMSAEIELIKNNESVVGVKIGEKTVLFPKPLKFRSDIPVSWISQNLGEYSKQVILLLRESLPPRPRLVIDDAEARVEYVMSDGFSIRPQYFFVKTETFMAFGELTYLYGKKEVITKKGEVKEVEVVDPVLVCRIIHNNGIEERKLFRLAERDTIIIGDTPLILEFKSKMLNLLPTLFDFEGVYEFLELNKSYSLREVFFEVVDTIKRYINFDYNSTLYYLLSCAIVATYFINIFNTFPHIYFLASFGEGKTRAGLTAVYLSRRGFVVTDPTEASVYRIAEALGPTLLIDDLRKKAEKLLHMSYKRGLKVPRVEKTKRETFILSLFDPFAPLFITDVELPKEVDLTRAIIIKMQKMPDPNPEKRDPEPGDFKILRRKLYIAALSHFEKVYLTYKLLTGKDTKIAGRDWEVWCPILTIAAFIGGEVWEQVYKYALENIEEKKGELYTTEREILTGIEELVIEELESLLLRLGQKEFKESKLDPLRREYEEILSIEDSEERKEAEKVFRVKLLCYILENELRFTAAQLLKYMKKVLVKREENEEAPYTEKQFEKIYSPQKIGRKLVVMGVPTYRGKDKRRERYKVVDLKLFINLCKKYNYEPRNEEVEELLRADISDVSDIKFEPIKIVKNANQSLFLEHFPKNEENKDVESIELRKREYEKHSLNQNLMSEMSEMSVEGKEGGGEKTQSPPSSGEMEKLENWRKEENGSVFVVEVDDHHRSYLRAFLNSEYFRRAFEEFVYEKTFGNYRGEKAKLKVKELSGNGRV